MRHHLAPLIAAALALVPACSSSSNDDGDGDGGPGATVRFGTTTVTDSRVVDAMGATLLGAAGTPIAGVTLELPPGVFQNETQVSIGYDSGTVTPADGIWGGVLLDVTTDYEMEFEDAMRVTVPFTATADEVPVPYYVTPSGELQAAELIAVDRDAGTFTFDTWHASSFTYILARLQHLAEETYDTKFDPINDGFQIQNDGSAYSRLGECMGMDAFALHYYSRYKAADGIFFPKFMSFIDPEKKIRGQDVIATRAHVSISRQWDYYYEKIQDQVKLTNREVYAQIRNALRNTRAPVLLSLHASRGIFGEDAKHNVLAYAYLGGEMFLYDSNYPGETRMHRFDGTNFAEYSSLLNSYGKTYLTGNGSLRLSEPLDAIYRDAKAGFMDSDAVVTVESHPYDSRTTDRIITLTGTVESGEILIEKIDIYSDRSDITTLVGPEGRFSAQVPLKAGQNWLLIRTYGRDTNGRLVEIQNNINNSRGHLINSDAERATLVVALHWDQPVDLDLYVTDPGGETAYFQNKLTDDGGELDLDNVGGYGPEHFTLTTSDTTRFGQGYLVKVHKFTAGDTFTKWWITVKINEGPAQRFDGMLTHGDSSNTDPAGTGSDWAGFITVTPVMPTN